MNKVLVTSIGYRKAYPVVKSLKHRGAYVIGTLTTKDFPNIAFSRFIDKVYKISDPRLNVYKYILDIKRIVVHEGVKLIVPIGFIDFFSLSKFYEELSRYTIVPVPPFEILRAVSDKYKLKDLTKRIGIKYPKTVLYPRADFKSILEQIGLPVVVKFRGDFSRPTIVFDKGKLKEELNKRGVCLVQEYVVGQGVGFFGFAINGKLLAFFMHKRIAEVDPLGGPSAIACSNVEPKLYELGKRFITYTKWTGVIMVEFKKDEERGELYLIEVNPKFWGSLDLSVSSGIDFPGYLYDYYVLGKMPNPKHYNKNVCFAWIEDLLGYIKINKAYGIKRCFHELIKHPLHNDSHLMSLDPAYTMMYSLRVGSRIFKLSQGWQKLRESNLTSLMRLIKYRNPSKLIMISDLDGTLIKLRVPWDTIKRKLIECGFLKDYENIFAFLYKKRKTKLFERVNTILKEYELAAIDYIKRDPILRRAICKLRKYCTLLCIISKQSKDIVKKVLKKLEIEDVIDLIIGREDALLRINQVMYCLKYVDINENVVVGLGDTLTDMKSYTKLGITSVLITMGSPLKSYWGYKLGLPYTTNVYALSKAIELIMGSNK